MKLTSMMRENIEFISVSDEWSQNAGGRTLVQNYNTVPFNTILNHSEEAESWFTAGGTQFTLPKGMYLVMVNWSAYKGGANNVSLWDVAKDEVLMDTRASLNEGYAKSGAQGWGSGNVHLTKETVVELRWHAWAAGLTTPRKVNYGGLKEIAITMSLIRMKES